VTGDGASCRTRFPALIDRAFVKGIAPRRSGPLRAHVEVCPSCRLRFDRLAAAEGALSPGRVLFPGALDRVAAEVAESRRSRWRHPFAWSAAGAVLATAAVLVVVVGTRGDSELIPRGGSGDELVPGQRRPGVRLFCLRPTGNGADVVAEVTATEPPVPPPVLACIIGGELQLAYSTPGQGGLTMVAFGRDETGTLVHYAPVEAGAPSVALAPDAIDEPLDFSTRLAVKHAPGTYNLVIRFFDRPIIARDATGAAAGQVVEVRAHLEIAPEVQQ
jgi:hypothetical protein